MRKIYPCFIILAFLFITNNASAQQQNCQGAVPFCTGQSYAYPATTGVGSNPQGIANIGCLCSMPNPAWYYMQMAPNSPAGSSLVINISGASSAQDVDFIAYGPFTSATGACTAGLTGTCGACTTAPNPGCSGGIEDCSYSTSSNEVAQITGTQPGEYYLLAITNFSNTAGTISFSQTSGSGITDCTVKCDFNTPGNMCPTSGAITLNNYLTGVNVATTGTWTTAPLSGGASTGLGVGAAGSFNPASYGTDQVISYAVQGGTCKDTIYMASSATATWNPPANVCANAASVNLTPLVTGTAGGTWTGTGVSGTTFNPAGLSGNQALTYTAGAAGCTATSTQNIPVIGDVDPAWTPPASLCDNAAAVNLNTLLTGTAGGTWSGTGVSGNNFNPSGLSGNQSITYTVGTSPCQETSTQNINVTPIATATWVPPAAICAISGSINLNTLITTGTLGGTWSGAGVTGSTFDPSAQSGPVSITYAVGTSPCDATSTQNITVNPLSVAAWTNPGSLCVNGGAVNLNTYLPGTSTSGGTWTGTGVTGNSFDPTGLQGTSPSITYTVGSGSCQDIVSQNITVNPMADATWVPGSPICATSGTVNLNTLITTGTLGGTWSGAGVTGSTFDPSAQSGPVSITYTVGTAPCDATSTQNITVNTLAVAAWTNPGTLCENAGVVNLNSYLPGTSTSGGTWSGTGVTGNTFNPTGLQGTSPSITYTAGSGSCQDVVSQNITIDAISDATWTSPSAMCTGSAIIDLNTTIGGTTGGTWSGTGVTGSNFDPAGLSGAQSITYTVGSGSCAATSTQNIMVNATATATWTNPGPICVGAGAINLDPFITGTSGGTWSGTGVTINSFDPTGMGGSAAVITYTVGVGVCQDVLSQSVVIDAMADASWTSPGTVCSGSAIIDLNTTIVGTLGGTWSGTGVTGSNFDPAGLSGPQSISYVVGPGACASTVTQNIIVNPTTTATWTNPGPLCVGAGAINLTPFVTGTAGGTWTGAGVSGNTFDPAGMGGSAAVITYTVGSGVCQDVLSQSVVIDPIADASWTNPGAICVNSSILDLSTTITGTSGGTWSGTGVTGSNFDPTGLSGMIAITYTVGAGACAATLTQAINVLPVVTATWTSFGPVCESAGIINLDPTITGTTGGTWTGTGITGNIFDPTGLGSQTINIVYTVGTSPCQDVLSQPITVTPAPSSLWTNPGALCQGTAAVDLNSYVTGLAGGAWTIDGVAGNIFDPAVLALGSHTVAYLSGTAPCQSSTTQTIILGPQVSAAWNAPTGFCTVSGSVNLNTLITGTTGGTWAGQGVSGNIFDPTGLTGNITITYSVGAVVGCQDVQSNVIAIMPDVNPAWDGASVPTYCANDSILDLNSLITGTTGGTWSGTGVTGSSFNPAGLSGLISITYDVGAAPCNETSTQTISIIAPPTINVISASVKGTTCFLANGSITGITASVAPLTYAWLTSNGDTIGTGADLVNIPNGVYTLQVTNSSACSSVTNSYAVGNTTLVDAGFISSVTAGSVPLEVVFTDTSRFGYTYSWDFGNETSSTAQNPTGNFYVAGTYDVLLTVHDSLGCVDTASIKIIVTEDFIYTIPNVFSPNGDASNDVFYVKGTGIKDVNCKIYNRWGQFMFEWTGPKGGWDGNTLSGATAPDGVYYYLIKITDKDGKELEPIQNYVTLVR